MRSAAVRRQINGIQDLRIGEKEDGRRNEGPPVKTERLWIGRSPAEGSLDDGFWIPGFGLAN